MDTGRIVGVCVGAARGQSKREVGSALLVEGWGMEGDAHGGSQHEISMLTSESIDKKSREMGVSIKPGDFAENLTTSGIDLASLPIGSLLSVGEAMLRTEAIGKRSLQGHTFSFHGQALLVAEGVFCNVVKGGRVKVGDAIRVARHGPENDTCALETD